MQSSWPSDRVCRQRLRTVAIVVLPITVVTAVDVVVRSDHLVFAPSLLGAGHAYLDLGPTFSKNRRKPSGGSSTNSHYNRASN